MSEEYTSDRIRHMTEREILYVMQKGLVTSDMVLLTFGDCPLSRTLIGDYEQWRIEYETPELYWDKVMTNLQAQVDWVKEQKAKGTKPPYARS